MLAVLPGSLRHASCPDLLHGLSVDRRTFQATLRARREHVPATNHHPIGGRRMLPMNPVKKVLAWLRPPVDPAAEAEAQRMRLERETIRTSQLTGPPNVPPTPDVLDPPSR